VLRHIVLFILVPLVLAAQPDPIWPEISSDLAPDPALRRGTLPNGFRYAVLPNAEPRDRVSLRLVVRAGSLHEREEERGLAHFLEHMAFRGTRRHPNGSLTTRLQKLGIAFGPDHTAFTLPHFTIYHLELPDVRESTLREAFDVFRAYAEDIVFDPALIERERGVILAELATRDTPQERLARATQRMLWPDSGQVARLPIGTPETIRAFTREHFRAFYNAWYRPERMALAVVGEIDPATVERLIAEIFSPLQPRGPARTETFSATPASASPPNVVVFPDPGLIGASCSILHPFPDPIAPDTRERRIQKLHRALAFAMFERRVARLAADEHAGFVSPYASVSSPVPNWSVAGFGVSGTIANWKEFMTQIEREHRRAMLHGFTDAELAAVRPAFVKAYADAVRTRPTQPSWSLIAELVSSLVHGTVFTTPATLQADLGESLATVTPAHCTRAFRVAWSKTAPHVFVATHPQFQVDPHTIAAAFNASREAPLDAPGEIALPEFAYTDFGPASAPVHTTSVPDLGVEQARFANGVRLNFKPTDFEADSVRVYVKVGDGRRSQPRSQPGLHYLAGLLVPQGGLRRHTYQELRDIAATRSVGVSFFVEEDALGFVGYSSRADLLFCLQLIAAQLTDSDYRADAMREIHAQFGSMYAGLAASAGGPISVFAERALTGGDLRFGIPTAGELTQRTPEEVAAWIEPQFQRGPIELSIVGDTTWLEASAAVSQTLGALPARDERRPVPLESVPLARPRKEGHAYSTASQLRQVALAWICPIPDGLADVPRERRCLLLAELLGERLRVRLREELGATYASDARLVLHEGFANLDYFHIYAEVSPEHARQAAVVMRREIAALRKGRFSEEEFERVRTPFLRQRQDDLRTNGYWGRTVLRDAQENPFRLAAARDRATDTASITRRDLQKLARRYLDPKHMHEFVAYPAPAATPALPPPPVFTPVAIAP
jgi:Predicted Zn-dependent peptidases